MTWEYLIGSEKDFEGAPDWADTVILDGNAEKVFVGCVDGFNLGCDERSPHHWYNFNISFVGAKIAQRKKVLLQKWDGVGLPPVGCECEALIPYLDEMQRKWRKVRVVFRGDEFNSAGEFVVIDMENTSAYWADEFRPLPTKERIEREDAINEMARIMSSHPTITHEAIADLIFDAGYRKAK